MKKSRYVIKSLSYDGNSNIFYNIRNGLGFKVPKHVNTIKELSEVDESMERVLDKYEFLSSANEAKDNLNDYLSVRESDTLQLIIMPHQNCNFRCVYCYEKFEKNKMDRDIEERIYKFAEKQVKLGNYKTISVNWFGGEPLLATDVIKRLSAKLIGLGNKFNIKYHAGITTNGYLMDDHTIETLLSSNVRHYQITIDGTKEIHDKQRILKGGQPTYEKIISNLKRLATQSENFVAMIRMNVGQDNLPDVNAYIAEMKRLFGKDKRFMLYFHNIGHWGGSNDANVKICNMNIGTYLTNKALDYGMNTVSAKKKIEKHATCYAADPHSFVIGMDGMLYKCTVALYEDVNHVGQLLEDGSLDLDEEKMKLWTESGVADKKCRDCFFSPSCHGESCPWIRIRDNVSPCPDSKSNVREIITTMDRQGYRFIAIDS